MASELVKYDDKFKDVINLSLNNVAIVDNIDNAMVISNKFKNNIRIVTLSGDLIMQSGSMTGGKIAGKTAGLIRKKRRKDKRN